MTSTTEPALSLTPETVAELRQVLPGHGRAHRRGDHRRGAELLRRAHRGDGRDHPDGRRDRARRLRPARLALQRRDPAGGGRSTAPTSSAAARRAAGARSTRCSRRTGSARASRGASSRPPRCAPASTPTPSPGSRPWSSPTSSSCRPPAWPVTPTSSRTPAASGSGCSSAWPCGSSTARPPRPSREAAERAEWRAPKTLTAVVVPGSQVRPVLASLSGETLQAAEAPQLADGEGEVALLVPNVHGRGRAGLAACARRPRCRGRSGPSVGAGGRVPRPGRAGTTPRARPGQRAAPRRPGAQRGPCCARRPA